MISSELFSVKCVFIRLFSTVNYYQIYNIVLYCWVGKSNSFVTPQTVACQAPLKSMGFPKQEYWSGWPFPNPNPKSSPGDLLGPRSNPCLLHWQVGSLPLNHQGNPTVLCLYSKSLLWLYYICNSIEYLPEQSPWTEKAGRLPSTGCKELDTTVRLSTAQCISINPMFLIYPSSISFGNHKLVFCVCESISVLQISSFLLLFRFYM